MFSLYFIWLLLFADIYLPVNLYAILLKTITAANIVVTFCYLFLGKTVQRYLMKDFLDRHVVHRESDNFVFGSGKSHKECATITLPKCMLCTEKIEIFHK
jgi:hypothetical protein